MLLIVELALVLCAVIAGRIAFGMVNRYLARRFAPPPAEELIETVEQARVTAGTLQKEAEQKAAQARAEAQRLEQLKDGASRNRSTSAQTRRV